MKKLKQNVSEDQRSNTQSLTPGREYSNLPVDLLIDIFLRVSSKAIARLRCVSKLWSSILRRQDFTELFLTKSLTLPRLLSVFNLMTSCSSPHRFRLQSGTRHHLLLLSIIKPISPKKFQIINRLSPFKWIDLSSGSEAKIGGDL
ncbi:F-box domain protein [Raphanus sativus]|nr:F-box domain protein [Raphanus sativus]